MTQLIYLVVPCPPLSTLVRSLVVVSCLLEELEEVWFQYVCAVKVRCHDAHHSPSLLQTLPEKEMSDMLAFRCAQKQCAKYCKVQQSIQNGCTW